MPWLVKECFLQSSLKMVIGGRVEWILLTSTSNNVEYTKKKEL